MRPAVDPRCGIGGQGPCCRDIGWRARSKKSHDPDQSEGKIRDRQDAREPKVHTSARCIATPSRGSRRSRWSGCRSPPGETLPFDRAYAIENGPGRFDPAAPRHLPKINFLMLMRDERLATLADQVRGCDRDAHHLPRRQAGGARPARDAARPPADRAVHRRLHEVGAARGAQDRARRRPQLLRRGRQVRAHRQPRQRARAGARAGPAGRPAALPRQSLSRGSGALGRVRLARQGAADRRGQAGGVRAHARCEATNVDPATGARDMAIPATPHAHLGPPGLRHLRQGRDGRRDRRSARPCCCLRQASDWQRSGQGLRISRAAALPCRERRPPRPRCARGAPDGAGTRAARGLLGNRSRRRCCSPPAASAGSCWRSWASGGRFSPWRSWPRSRSRSWSRSRSRKRFMVPPEGPVVPAAALVAVAGLVAAVLTRRRLGLLMRQRRLKAIVEPLFPLVVAEFVADVTRLAHALAIAVGHVARLLQLLAIGHDDARVVLGVLQIVLCQHRIAGSLRIAGEREILLRDMRRRAPDLHIRSVGFEAARQRIVAFPVVVIPAATAAILLSLPHCPNGSYVTSTSLINAHPRSREHGSPCARARLRPRYP